jgi:DNA (cytosine-5)-methyltransferase 1
MGKRPDGEKFGLRFAECTAFNYIDAKTALQNLPDLEDGHPQICIPYPDHRVGKVVTARERLLIRHIPKEPRGKGLISIMHKPLPQVLRDYVDEQSDMRRGRGSHSWTRLDHKRPFRTIVATLNPSDAKASYGLHWNEDRVLTVLEARRAQGYPDHEPSSAISRHNGGLSAIVYHGR